MLKPLVKSDDIEDYKSSSTVSIERNEISGHVGNALNKKKIYLLVKKAVQNDPIFSGLENDVYVHDGKVIRVPKLEEYNLLMQREFEISKVLNKAGLPFQVPEISLVKYEGKTCTVYKFLEGKQISKKEYNELDEKTQLKIIKNIVDAQLAFGNVNIDTLKGKLLDKPSYILDYSELESVKDLYPDLVSIIQSYIDIHKLGIKNSLNDILCHGDLHFGNILFNNDFDIVGVIDFGATSICNPVYNFNHFNLISKSALSQAIKYYNEKTGIIIDEETIKSVTALFRIGHLFRFQNDPKLKGKSEEKIAKLLLDEEKI